MIRWYMVKSLRWLIFMFALSLISAATGLFKSDAAAASGDDELYPYNSRRFAFMVKESFDTCRAGNGDVFFNWMEEAYRSSSMRLPGKESLAFPDLLKAEKQELQAISVPSQKAQAEIALSAWLHKFVKKVIPRFSLERGFEFCNVVKCGERQCFLQSILIAGLLQEMGVDAGVAMVYRNIRGEYTNNGHAVALVKLPDGRDIIVDASDPEPFARHKGLFVRERNYRYVEPVYAKDSDAIIAYRPASGKGNILTSLVRTLDFAFIASQFWYYRGERTPGGLLSKTQTRKGLRESEIALQTSVRLNPGNPLAVFMLGRVLLAEGDVKVAKSRFGEALDLYSRYGWIPEGPKQFYTGTK